MKLQSGILAQSNPPPSLNSGARVADGTDVLDLPVLVLNRLYVPIRVCSVRRALVQLYGGSAQALDADGELYHFEDWARSTPLETDDFVPLVQGKLRAPRLLHLSHYDRTPKLTLRLTRQNLYLRDHYQCQYCGKRPHVAELNLDHVLPRASGGIDSWENLVVSCRPCNLKKGKRTPREAGMTLLRTPHVPSLSHAALLLQGLPAPFAEWKPFLATG
jgi:5-methylcytosine-specific restriction endonuclease McrA